MQEEPDDEHVHGVMIAGHLLMLPAMALAMLRRREEYLHG